MNINQIKPIRQLPELEDHQEWACEGGCDHIEPKLFRNVYQQSWDLEGKLTSELAEHYYTCQHGHVLEVWNEEVSDYATLPDEVYQPRENPGLNLKQVQILRDELDAARIKYTADELGEVAKYFKFAKVSFEITFKNQKTLSVDHDYLNEIEATILESEIQS